MNSGWRKEHKLLSNYNEYYGLEYTALKKETGK
jgi:hypothetical protein